MKLSLARAGPCEASRLDGIHINAEVAPGCDVRQRRPYTDLCDSGSAGSRGTANGRCPGSRLRQSFGTSTSSNGGLGDRSRG